jgi:hypothetical protein
LCCRNGANIGGYLGWQLLLLTRETMIRDGESERKGTALNGDAAGFRTGLFASHRFRLWQDLWLSALAAGGLQLVHQNTAEKGSESIFFFRPHFSGQVEYAF